MGMRILVFREMRVFRGDSCFSSRDLKYFLRGGCVFFMGLIFFINKYFYMYNIFEKNICLVMCICLVRMHFIMCFFTYLKENAAYLKKYIYILFVKTIYDPTWSQSYQWRRLLQNLLQS